MKNSRTNIFMLEPEIWKWAKYKSELKGYNSVSDYIFALIKLDKEKNFIK